MSRGSTWAILNFKFSNFFKFSKKFQIVSGSQLLSDFQTFFYHHLCFSVAVTVTALLLSVTDIGLIHHWADGDHCNQGGHHQEGGQCGLVTWCCGYTKKINWSKFPKTQNKPIKIFFEFCRGRSELQTRNNIRNIEEYQIISLTNALGTISKSNQ